MVIEINNFEDLTEAIKKINDLATEYEAKAKKEEARKNMFDLIENQRTAEWAKLHGMFHDFLPGVKFDREILESLIDTLFINNQPDYAFKVMQQYAFCKELNKLSGIEE